MCHGGAAGRGHRGTSLTTQGSEMVSRHTLIYLLFFVVAGTVAVLGPRETHSASPDDVPHIPEQALTALRDGRVLRASLILR